MSKQLKLIPGSHRLRDEPLSGGHAAGEQFSPLADGPALRSRRPWYDLSHLTATVGVLVSLTASFAAQAGDILRGGAPAAQRGGKATGATSVQAVQADSNARDALARTTQALQAVKAMQKSARDVAAGSRNFGLPSVPNGLVPGGLQVAPGVPANLTNLTAGEDAKLWQGASLPEQTASGGRTKVVVRQNSSRALLHWKTFNIGESTTLKFDQSAGKERSAEWIVFNKVNDPSGKPSQILGSIEAEGQVYVINQNGIIFGGASQINTRAFVGSTLPINDNLIQQGLLNNPDAQFLFSALPVPGGTGGTPAFNPTATDPEFVPTVETPTYTFGEKVALTKTRNLVRTPDLTFRAADGSKVKLIAGTDYTVSVDPLVDQAVVTFTPTGLGKIGGTAVTATYTPAIAKSGDIVVQAGARLASPVSADGNGGRVMLVGPNVTNAGTISTPAGQTILAAGQQVGVAAHASTDPSLRGLDVWVGAVAEGSGKATNSGLIEALTGSVSMSGRTVEQLGAIESSTSVDLNGRIDLRASYGAVGNPGFRTEEPPFFFQHTGVVRLGVGSVTRILPDYASESSVPGTTLPQKSQINVEGLAIHAGQKALMMAPNADVNFRAGIWPYVDVDGNRTTINDALTPPTTEANLSSQFSGRNQRFLFSAGQIYLDPSSLVTVAGSTDVLVPLAHSILDVEFRGSEFADSPLQRGGALRAVPLTLDLRQTGVLDGRYWIGTSLGDATGLAGLIQRNAAQLTAAGGNVTFRAGGSIVVQAGARIDVSGGYFKHEGGMVNTTRLLQQGRLVDIANARPDQIYAGIFTGQFVVSHTKYGLSETYQTPFMNGARYEAGYLEGAAGGTLNLTAPSMALDGELLGLTVEGPRQRSARGAQSRLSLTFEAERINPINLGFGRAFPTPPTVVLANVSNQPSAVPAFTLKDNAPVGIGVERESLVTLSPELLEEDGFGHLTVVNPDGDVLVPEGTSLLAPARGSISLTGRNVTIGGEVSAPAGELNFRVLNLSPAFVEDFQAQAQIATPLSNPLPNVNRGLFTLAAGATLDTSGLLVDDRLGSPTALTKPLALAGGAISIEAYSADLAVGSSLDVSGGVRLNTRGQTTFGNGGSLSILTGRDLSMTSVTGGKLFLGSSLRAYSGGTGGTLALRAMSIQVGGTPQFPNTLLLDPEFFRRGGFTSYALTGIGTVAPVNTTEPGEPDAYVPAISVAPGVTVTPVAESWLVLPHKAGSPDFMLQPILRPVGVRSPVSLSFTALGSDDPYTLEVLEARGDLVIGAGARIETDPGANIALEGGTVTLHGALVAPGGTISLKGAARFPGVIAQVANIPYALPTVHIGSTASISTAGATTLLPDAYGRRMGTVRNGGTITVYGNIVAEKGAVLDVSGISAVLDLTPSALGQTESAAVSARSGVNTPLERLRTVPTRVDSSGGLLELEGAQMLLSDATLLGHAGGPTAGAGTLSIHSGRFYQLTSGNQLSGTVTNADINLSVAQRGDFIPGSGSLGIGRPVLAATGEPIAGMGYFAIDRFAEGGFDSLELGAKFLTVQVPGSPLSGGGNIQFIGPVSINARGYVRLAAGGIIQADAPVSVRAPYVSVGQPFLAPQNPSDPKFTFQQSVNGTVSSTPLAVPPLFGTGSLSLSSDFIDLGTLSLQGVGRALLHSMGDIRGNGTVAIQGDLTLRADQIYPTTLATLNLVAYDPIDSPGSITIQGGGPAATPMSAGGTLNVFASRIVQAGVLKAPFGSITIGWDGKTDYDRNDADIDAPTNAIVGQTLPHPTATEVILQKGSVTSVSAIDSLSGDGMLLPYGISPDGFSWIDPRGVDVTTNGLPEKRVTILGEGVSMEAGSVVDIRGGGDLYAFRSVLGNGGSADRLGTASAEWNAGTTYQSGDLVLFDGQTWTARVASTGQKPTTNSYWSQVVESFAVIPGYTSPVASLNSFNSGTLAMQLQGDPGYVFTPNVRGDRVFTSLASTKRTNTGLQIGDQIYLNGTPGLDAGTYTLLPRRYALFPDAFLVTPQTGELLGTITLADGASITGGYRFNSFTPANLPEVLTRYEVAPSETTRSRSGFVDYLGNAFFAEAAQRLEIKRPQPLPTDAGHATFHGNSSLSLAGSLFTSRPADGRGASVDISSFADIFLSESGSAPEGAVVLNPGTITSWGVESVLIGGLRHLASDQMTVEVRTSNLVLDKPGAPLSGPEITLASRAGLTLTAGSSVIATGVMSQSAESFAVVGDGTLLRVSADSQNAALTRTGVTGSAIPVMDIGAGARLGGASVILDSTYGTRIDASASIGAQSLALGSGQISIVLDPAGALTDPTVDPHLTIAGNFLTQVGQAESLTLRSYRTIDLYGAGTFGSTALREMEFLATGIRGYGQADGAVVIQAGDVLFSNPNSSSTVTLPLANSGSLQVDAATVRLGAGSFSIAGYHDVTLNASSGVIGRGNGGLSTSGNLTINTPLLSGERSSTQAVTAGGALSLNGGAATTGILEPGLGASFTFTGESVLAHTTIRLPSGQLTLRARSGNVVVGGNVDLAGTTQQFYDLTRYSDAGSITLTSDAGNVELLAGSTLTVAGSGLGKAGTIGIRATQGSFLNQGTLLGSASEEANSGTFLLDVLTAPEYAVINDPLQAGGFFKERNIRVRSGSVTMAGETRALNFTLSADMGGITVTGKIDASGATGGKIVLVSGGSLTLASGSLLTAHAADFSSAGKGGAIRLEAGAAIDGLVNPLALLDLQAGSTIDLRVDTYVAGDYTNPASSAFYGKFRGTLHLRAPQLGNDIQIGTLSGGIVGASAILAEGFRVYEVPAGTYLDPAFREMVRSDAGSFMDASYTTIEARLLAAHPELQGLLVIAPGVEIFSRGDLVLGSDFDDPSYDWDLSGFRFGPMNAPGVLTMRAAGNLEFKNALSDGFAGDFSPNDFGEVPQPGQELWLRPLMDIVSTLPTNTQSWSYRLAAGADLKAADFRQVVPSDELADGKGSLAVGKFYPATLVFGESATTAEAINNRYQVIRTGTGDIDIAAGRDVQLRNQFATVYTAGVRLPYSNTILGESEVRLMSIFAPNDFAVPLVELSTSHPDQGLLGAFQQAYAAQYAMAGGNVTIAAQRDIVRFSVSEGQIDSSRQLPNNWLYRRGYVDPATGVFGNGAPQGLNDLSASTTWWVDYSNFFQGFGTLGGGDVALLSGRNIINADAVAATNARMPGRNDATGENLTPDASKLVELGGGDITIRAGNNIDGGIYYAERGQGTLSAGGEIKTNAARSPSIGALTPFGSPQVLDPLTWLPTTLFVGKSQFDVSAAGNILLGPVSNPFFLPQGVNNKFWYKTYFNTYSSDAEVSVASFGGSVTHRWAVTPGGNAPVSTLQAFLGRQNVLTAESASFYEPWIRLSETIVDRFDTVATVSAPTLRSTAFAGDVNLVGTLNLFPSSQGTLELAASHAIVGLQPSGTLPNSTVRVWISGQVNLSDADPALQPGIASPLAYQDLVGAGSGGLSESLLDPFAELERSFQETGSFTGSAGTIQVKQALHGLELLHANDPDPVRIYALGGDITALTLYAPKATQVAASNDISDVAFYIQNASPQSISFVSAGRDIIPFNENTGLRTIARDLDRGNTLANTESRGTVINTISNSLAGDLQISGPGVLEVLAGRNLDLGTGANLNDGTGVGLTSIGSARNPSLPTAGADLIVFAGLLGLDGVGPALGLSGSTMDLEAFAQETTTEGAVIDSPYLARLGGGGTGVDSLTPEQQAIVTLENFYRILRDTGRDSATDGFISGFAAISTLFGTEGQEGEIFTRTRDIRTASGGAISIAVPSGGLTMASDIFGNPLTPPGIVTEFGGAISMFTDASVDIGQARIFTLRGGDILIWSSTGNIAAGTAPKTVVTAPPTRVIIDATSAAVQTDLGGLATGGGIGVLASVEGVPPGDVDLIAPGGVVDAGDAGIRSTGNLSISAVAVLNASNIQVAGTSSGVPTAPPVAAVNLGAITSASNAASAGAASATQVAQSRQEEPAEELPSIIDVEVVGYSGGETTTTENFP